MKLTGSGVGRAEICPPSTVLPQVRQKDPESAARGTAIHNFLREVAIVGPEKALKIVPDKYLLECSALDLEALPHSDPNAWAVEVALAWNWESDTARELARGNGDRDYSSVTETELPGTVDVLGVTADAVIVLDVKTGFAPLGSPRTAAQLLAYAVAAARCYGKTSAIVGWIKIPDGGDPRFERAHLDMLELDAAAARLRSIIDGALAAELLYQADPSSLALTTGDHCKYCPAFSQCPAQVGLIQPFIDAAPESADSFKPLNAQTAPMVYQRAQAVQKVLNRVFEIIDDFAMAQPFDLPGGEKYGNVECTRETIDALMAQPVLDEINPAIAAEAIKVTTELTKADLERALRRHKRPGQKITHAVRDAHKALHDAGAMKVSKYFSVKRFKPKPIREVVREIVAHTISVEAEDDHQEGDLVQVQEGALE